MVTMAVVAVVSVMIVMVIVKRHVVTVRVMAETLVANGMSAPIRMTAFPFVESRNTRPIQGQPYVVGAQIIVL